MKVVISQFKPVLNRERNLERHLEILRKIPEADFVIFPELSLNGYYLQDKVFEDFWKLEELEEIRIESQKFDILVGAVIKEGNSFYNSALHFSKGELLGIHHKVFLPNYGLFEEARFFKSGKGFKVLETSFGRVVNLVCEDAWRSETLLFLESEKPDFVFIISNSPARGFEDSGEIEVVENWKSILKTISIFSGATVVFSNRVGFEEGLGFWGGSMIIQNGKELLSLPYYEEAISTLEI